MKVQTDTSCMEQRCFMCKRTKEEIVSDLKIYSDFDKKASKHNIEKKLEECFPISINLQPAFFLNKRKDGSITTGNGFRGNYTFEVNVPICSVCESIMYQHSVNDSVYLRD